MDTSVLREHRQLDDVVVWHRFNSVPGLAPGTKSSGNDKNLETFFLE
jgi:hypothetical protein